MTTTRRNAAPKARLQIERLENREVLSASFIDGAGNLVVKGTTGNDTVRVSDFNDQGTPWVKVEVNTQVEWQKLQNVTHREVILYGYQGNDSLTNDTGALQALTYGGDGNDVLVGGSLADRLVGGTGNDALYGRGGADVLVGEGDNDKLFGGAGYDSLYGGAGNDFLDGEQDGAFYHGGQGLDTAAIQTSINGCSRNDVFQKGASSCWFLSSLGAATVLRNIANDLIRYEGNGNYTVFFYNAGLSRWEGQSVLFDGTTNAGDAGVTANGNTMADAGGCEGEFWVTLMQRGLHARYGVNYLDANAVRLADYGYGAGKGGVASVALSMLGAGSSNLAVTDLAGMRSALASGKALVAGFKAWNKQTTGKLVSEAHAYQVVAIAQNGTVTLRNPWGHDGCRIAQADQGADDGYVYLTWGEFINNATAVTASA